MTNRPPFRLKRLAALVILYAVSTTPAFGYFVYDGEANQFFQNPPAGDRPVVQVGSGTPGKASGFGQQVPLSGALQMITPDGWQVQAPNVGDPKVSWSGDQAWTETLERVAETEGVRFLVNWDKQALLVARSGEQGPGDGPSKALSNMAEAGSSNPDDTPIDTAGGEQMHSDSTSPDAAQSEGAQVKTWTLEPGGVRDQLKAWSERAGYSYVWHAPDDDYLVEVDIEIDGTFVDVMNQVIGSLHSSGVPIRADIYRSDHNSVVVIRES